MQDSPRHKTPCPFCGERVAPTLWSLVPSSRMFPPTVTCTVCGKVSAVTRGRYGVALLSGMMVAAIVGVLSIGWVHLGVWPTTIITTISYFGAATVVTRLILRLERRGDAV